MQITHEQMVEFFRTMHVRPAGTAAVLNLIRASEVRGAVDLGAAVEVITDPELTLAMARHAADEARHAYLLTRRMQQLGAAPWRLPIEVDRTESWSARRVGRDSKFVYHDRGRYSDEEMVESVVLIHLLEADALPKVRANFESLDQDPDSQAVMGSILKDEVRHVAYLTDWIARLERRFSRLHVAAIRDRLEADLAQLNLVFYASLDDYLRRAADPIHRWPEPLDLAAAS